MWHKRLYHRQPFPDNYVDPQTFLRDLRKNIHVRHHTISELRQATTPLCQHLSAIAIFLCMFQVINKQWLTERQLVVSANIFTIIGYSSWMWWIREMESGKMSVNKKQPKELQKQQLKAAMIFLMVLLGVSPVLKTLTEDYSSDTIASMTFALMLLNLCFTDYSMLSNPQSIRVNAIALNAAIFASVVLASRLSSPVQVFGLMSLAVNWFCLFPLLRGAIRYSLPDVVNYLLTGVMVLVATVGVWWCSDGDLVLPLLFVATIAFITFIAPLWFIRLQRLKNNIHGPWDEARITD